jgi:cysteinyl-tRNA synthetase
VSGGAEGEPTPGAFDGLRARFAEAMDDDINTPQALAVLFDGAREINRRVEQGASPEYRAAARVFFDDLLDGVLGIPAQAAAIGQTGDVMDGLVGMLLAERQQARARRDFSASDAMRARLEALGIEIEDTSEGTRWKLV